MKALAAACWIALAAGLESCSLQSLTSTLGIEMSVQGEALVQSAQIGDLALRPQICRSGDLANFRGVDLLGAPLVLRITADPLEGLGVALIEPESGDRRGVFRRADCSLLRGDVQRTGWRVNNVAVVSGFVELDCKLPSGEAVAGSIAFENCR